MQHNAYVQSWASVCKGVHKASIHKAPKVARSCEDAGRTESTATRGYHGAGGAQLYSDSGGGNASPQYPVPSQMPGTAVRPAGLTQPVLLAKGVHELSGCTQIASVTTPHAPVSARQSAWLVALHAPEGGAEKRLTARQVSLPVPQHSLTADSSSSWPFAQMPAGTIDPRVTRTHCGEHLK